MTVKPAHPFYNNATAYFAEYDEYCALLNKLKESENRSDSYNVTQIERRIYKILDKYQTQSCLLDSCLEISVQILFSLVAFVEAPETVNVTPRKLLAFRILYYLTKICGYKIVIKFLPSHIQYFKTATSLLMKLTEKNSSYTSAWESRYMLLLWLSVICMNPFDIRNLDSDLAINEIYDHTRMYLLMPDKTGEGAANVSKWINQLLCMKNSSSRKLVLKTFGRIALCRLPYSAPLWRYSRGSRNLNHEFIEPKTEALSDSFLPNTFTDESSSTVNIPEELDDIVDYLLVGLEDLSTVVRWTSAKYLGRITERIPLNYADEVVRGVLNIFSLFTSHTGWHGGCLALAELARRGLLLPEHLSSVMPLVLRALVYEHVVGDCRVGSHVRDAACYVCWAFARAYEPRHLRPYASQLSTWLLTLACFDREGTCRRAASAAFQEHVGRQGLFPHGFALVTLADYSNVGPIGRAFLKVAPAVASFECYRLPLVSYAVNNLIGHWDRHIRLLSSRFLGIVVLTFLYFFSCYLFIIFPVFIIIIQANIDSEMFLKGLLGQLSMEITSLNHNTRHGTLLAVAEIMETLHQKGSNSGRNITDELMEMSAILLEQLEKLVASRSLYHGPGAGLIRCGVLRLIRSLSFFPLPQKQSTFFIKVVLENISDEQSLYESALNALETLGTNVLSIEHCHELLKTVLLRLEDKTSGLKGLALALSRLPCANEVLLLKIIEKLSSLLHNSKDSEVRRHVFMAINFLVLVFLVTLFASNYYCSLNGCPSFLKTKSYNSKRQKTSSFSSQKYFCLVCSTLGHLFKLFFCKPLINNVAPPDRADQRGDVGSWVRECASLGVEIFFSLFNNQNCFDPNLITTSNTLLLHLLGVVGDRIDRTRSVALKALLNILHTSKLAKHIHGYPFLMRLVEEVELRHAITICCLNITITIWDSSSLNIELVLFTIWLLRTTLPAAMLALVKRITRKYAFDYQRIRLCIKVICFVNIQFPPFASDGSFFFLKKWLCTPPVVFAVTGLCQLLCFLSSKDGSIRHFAAKELLENLLFSDSIQNKDEIQDLLSTTDWFLLN
ncbi:hypothetical protein Zmor_012363 [Zophobas morio]|uniref:Tubulin-folding cofactor D ARM repeats domain-containing protein n=1 Tax=Zophobas morio TaxID=2755281 RepID=A0AA38LYT9_9CUCU|nr:hypothetical protein Zmor_012363 [Zophobas morio]